MAIRLYHLASELDVASSELLTLLGNRGMKIPSVMSVMDDSETEKARQVATGRLEIAAKPAPGMSELKLPPPVVPAPARPIHPVSRPGARPSGPGAPGQRRYPGGQQRQPQRRGIKIFRQKEARQKSRDDKLRAEELLTNRTIPITVPLSLKEFSQEIGVKTSRLQLHLMREGVMTNPNTSLDEEMVLVLAEAFNRTVEIEAALTIEDKLDELLDTHDEVDESNKSSRPPVVAVLGHVDHGKTSLLDYIRKARVAAGEAGGITQHIGAYQVTLGGKKSKRKITFLDTPGHEAFTAMRARGAQLTDIVILIVAVEDGVMPQTLEALAHAKAAGCPIVVAINKCDRPNSDPERVKHQLATADLAPEEWGGTTAMIPISAITGMGIDDLLERIALEAELLDLKATPDRPAEGFVVEARKQTGRGVVATMLVKDGTLKKGDFLLSGACQGKIKSLTDHTGKRVDTAPPATPVEVTGLDVVPEAGGRFQVILDKGLAKKVAADRSHRQREKEIASKQSTSFERLMHRIGETDMRELRVVLKADVKGSIEALRAKLDEIGNEEVRVKLLHAGVGGITESDVLLAQASEAVVLGFHVVAGAKARAVADEARVEIRTYQIIYKLLEDMTLLAEGMLPSDTEEVVIGHFEIRTLFKHKKRNIGGGMVTDGMARKDAHVRLIRDSRVIIDNGELESLRRFKDDAKEVKEGFECGVMIASYGDIKEGDILEFYILEERKRTL